jgi:hypothetical protein
MKALTQWSVPQFWAFPVTSIPLTQQPMGVEMWLVDAARKDNGLQWTQLILPFLMRLMTWLLFDTHYNELIL